MQNEQQNKDLWAALWTEKINAIRDLVQRNADTIRRMEDSCVYHKDNLNKRLREFDRDIVAVKTQITIWAAAIAAIVGILASVLTKLIDG